MSSCLLASKARSVRKKLECFDRRSAAQCASRDRFHHPDTPAITASSDLNKMNMFVVMSDAYDPSLPMEEESRLEGVHWLLRFMHPYR